jgi:propanol-preferring alcohol dehydrogenase
MKAIRLVEHGRPLVEIDMDQPVPGPGEVQVAVGAAGICRSDVHYRSGARPVRSLPLVPGHEVAGTVVGVGEGVSERSVGDRVAIHYLISCGGCEACLAGREQFCETGAMVGLDRAGGYAESIVVPSRNAYPIPESIPTEVAAIMMCSSSTSLHALRRGRFTAGESVAVVGCGGLGMSAIKIAMTLGASKVFAVDIDDRKLELAAGLGALPVRPEHVSGIDADVALELVGLPETMRAAVDALGVQGRAVAVGLAHEPFALHSFNDLILKEAEVIGAMDHFGSEIEELFSMVGSGALDLSDVVTATVPLNATAINEALDRLEAFDGGVRTVIVPTSH